MEQQKTPSYNSKLKETARKLRKAGILHEVLLWQQLKCGKLNGLDWTRQKIIGNYIVDFYNAPKKVVIETDGYSHDNENKQNSDAKRDEYLKSLGIAVIRVLAKDVLQNLDSVMGFLRNHVKLKENTNIFSNTPSALRPPLLKKGE